MSAKVGRNDPCHCGSGKKYKKCCQAGDLTASKKERSAKEAELAAEEAARIAERQARIEAREKEAAAARASLVEPEPEPELEPLEETRGDILWKQFEALDNPDPAELEALLAEMTVLPADEEMPWSEIFADCAKWESIPLDKVFRQISENVAPVKENSLSYFYWRAAEDFSKHKEKYGYLLNEVADKCCELDVESYDIDAIDFVSLYLLQAGCTDGALKLAEHFLPVVREDSGLTDWAVPDYCNSLFEMRIGRALREQADAPVEEVANSLRRGIEEDIDETVAKAAAEVIADPDQGAAFQWERAVFNLVDGNIYENDDAWNDCVSLFSNLVRVAQEHKDSPDHPPEKTVPALMQLLKSAYKSRKKKNKKAGKDNLLDILKHQGMEERIASVCQDLMGTNEPKADLLIYAHEVLYQTAVRRDLISAKDAEKTKQSITRIRTKLADL